MNQEQLKKAMFKLQQTHIDTAIVSYMYIYSKFKRKMSKVRQAGQME